jgi:hypothetical protein
MKTSAIDKTIKFVDMENAFYVYIDENDKRRPFVYNLNSTLYFKGVPSKEYKVDHDKYWTTLSYELYRTTRLWWILMKVNNVDQDNLFEPVRAGSTIRYIDESDVRHLLSIIGA